MLLFRIFSRSVLKSVWHLIKFKKYSCASEVLVQKILLCGAR